ncbi:MAG: DUF1538 domain-containing protein [Myxococcales bacterium]|nr:MAG: DUF1538 domain-containing protein [Myxococcales bacterium]
MNNAAKPEKINVTVSQALRILGPYMWHNLKEQLVTVIPVCLYLALFQWVILRHGFAHIGWIVGGILIVVLGLFFFLEGVKIGLAPVGEVIGDTLPKKCSMLVLLLFAFVLGLVGAFGEPVIGSLQIAGAGVDPQKAPLLFELLVGRPMVLSIVVSLGVGVAVMLGTLRFLFGWSLKPIILPIVGLSVAATLLAAQEPALASTVGLAWDTGAVIVGPVLCPLVLALGLGIFRATGKSDTGMAGFGMVGLISVVPIVSVLLLTYVLHLLGVGGAAATPARAAAAGATSIVEIFVDSLLMAVRAIGPVFLFLWLFMRLKLREPGIPLSQYLLGAAFALTGLFLFNSGLSLGLAELGNQVGSQLPSAFHPPENSLYPSDLGKIIVIVFGVVLGYGATLAEPAFNILGQQVEDVTQGAFKKWLFSQAVAIGVGIGAGMGILSTVYHVDLLHLLLPPYVVLFILTLVSKEEYVNIAWDGGSVTTGPVTVPLKIAIGIALSHATGFAEGFGILALASAYPVMNILLLGLFVRYMERRNERARLEARHG